MGTTPRWRYLLFDLDGTLTDPVVGITQSVAHALRRCGYRAPGLEELGWVVGPPLRGAFAQLAGTEDRAAIDALIAAYRERFAPVGMFENTVHPGVPELLADCAAAGCRLALATSKPSVFARRILRHFRLDAHVAAVAGSYLDGRRADKAAVVRYALRLLGAPAEQAVMVGDRVHDIEGGRTCGVEAIGVRWGYAEAGELEAARPAALCGTVGELRAVLLG